MALVWLLSNCYQKTSPNAANPHKYWLFTVFRFIPTLSIYVVFIIYFIHRPSCLCSALQRQYPLFIKTQHTCAGLAFIQRKPLWCFENHDPVSGWMRMPPYLLLLFRFRDNLTYLKISPDNLNIFSTIKITAISHVSICAVFVPYKVKVPKKTGRYPPVQHQCFLNM